VIFVTFFFENMPEHVFHQDEVEYTLTELKLRRNLAGLASDLKDTIQEF
jgi:hypothetical protein